MIEAIAKYEGEVLLRRTFYDEFEMPAPRLHDIYDRILEYVVSEGIVTDIIEVHYVPAPAPAIKPKLPETGGRDYSDKYWPYGPWEGR